MSVKYKHGLLPIEWTSHMHNCTKSYDRFHRLSLSKCGPIVESKQYNERNGRLEQLQQSCHRKPTKFSYAPSAYTPRQIMLPSGTVTSYEYDNIGGLVRITLPGIASGIETVSQSGIMGILKTYIKLPGLTDPYVIHWSNNKLVLQVRPPSGTGITVYRYNSYGNLEAVASGDVLTQYVYNAPGQLRRINHQTNDITSTLSQVYHEDQTWKNKNHRTVLKETRISYNTKSSWGLANCQFFYEYGPGGTNLVVGGRIGGHILPSHFMHHSWASSIPGSNVGKGIGQFTVHVHNLNETSIVDGVATFLRSSASDSLVVNGRELYRAEYTYNSCGSLESTRMKMVKKNSGHNNNEFKQTWRFGYDSDGQLDNAEIVDTSQWRYSYDQAGNLLDTTFYSGEKFTKKLTFEYDDNGWLRKQMGKDLVVGYDTSGRIIYDLQGRFLTYRTDDLLTTVTDSHGSKVNYVYDHMRRLVAARKDDGKVTTTQYFYSWQDKPYLVSHVYSTTDGSLSTLVYGDDDRLVFVEINSNMYYVVCDKQASPILLVTPGGRIAKEITRTPYGEVTFDSDRSIDVPLGFAGGISDRGTTDLVHFQGVDGSRPYDPMTGMFPTPSWNTVLAHLFDPLSLRLYRYRRNDPINPQNPFEDVDGLMRKIKANIVMAFPAFDVAKLGDLTSFYLGKGTKSLSKSRLLRSLTSLRALSVVQPSALLTSSSSSALIKISKTPAPLGKYVALCVTDGKKTVSINSIPSGAVNEVQRSVFTSVFSGASLVDYASVQRGHDVYFFTKTHVWQSANDIKALHKLGPKINLTTHDTQTLDGGLTMDVKVHLENAVVNIRYGTTADKEKARLLRHASKVIGRKVWSKQKELLATSSTSSSMWNTNERQQLLIRGIVDGYEIAYNRDIVEYPELANDLANVQIVKRRKSSNN